MNNKESKEREKTTESVKTHKSKNDKKAGRQKIRPAEHPLTLWSLQVRPYSQGDEVDTCFPGAEYFDDRTCFLVSPLLYAVSVLMTFGRTGNKSIHTENPRQVTVCLSDETTRTDLASVTTDVPHTASRGQHAVRADLRLAYASVDTSHTYAVTVRDSETGQMLGQKSIVLFGTTESGHDPALWFSLVRGAIFARNGRGPYKSFAPRERTYVRLYLGLEASEGYYRHFAPELEVWLHTPDGKRESFFCRIEAEGCGEYSAELPLAVIRGRRGVCYALVRCMGKPIGGMLFDLAGDREDGYWYSEHLSELDRYHPMTAPEELYDRLHEDDEDPGAGHTDGENEDSGEGEEDKEDFDRLLDKFLQDCREEALEDSGEADEEASEICDDDATAAAEAPGDGDEGDMSEIGLDRLTGLGSVKTKLESYRKVMLFNRRRIDAGLSALRMPLHSMFLGAPGTGKTTVARMMGRMLAQAGVLSRGHLVECERSTLIGTCYGSAEEATRKALEEARGGILFIDEAYQLQSDDSRDPGRMVIESLMTALADEENRDWMLILAGYPDETRRLFDLNPGLKSRIPETNVYTFDSLTEAELMEVAERYLSGNDYVLTDESRQVLRRRICADFGRRDRSFGNARHIINMIQTEVIPAMAMRVAAAETAPDVRLLSEIQPSDIVEAPQAQQPSRRSIGYH